MSGITVIIVGIIVAAMGAAGYYFAPKHYGQDRL